MVATPKSTTTRRRRTRNGVRHDFCLAGNDLDYSVNGVTDFVITKMSGRGNATVTGTLFV